jgi:putative transposase
VPLGEASEAYEVDILDGPGGAVLRTLSATSPSLRLTREHGLQAPHRLGRPRGPRAHDGTIRTERVDEMWGTDLTATLTGEGQAAVFILVDHCSGECLGIHAARRATRFEALESLRQAVRHSFGAFGKGLGQGTKLRHDHGSQFVSDDFQAEVAFLGLESSPAFVREPRLQGLLALSPAEIG